MTKQNKPNQGAAITSIVMSLVIDTNILVRFYVFTVWLFHGLSMIGLIVMRITKPQLTRPYKVTELLYKLYYCASKFFMLILPHITRILNYLRYFL
ncbi:hypothetical protein KUTeg_019608 [Tegillarca granosa]|uniref:Uncharacterized protein n=1 Tax=Tegillarca granosa TaxID=220873 RepID=A0ABQ9EH35_TEGGR|nr:hypothetical protein KUTeg_019608 [Tegillarca granosa]